MVYNKIKNVKEIIIMTKQEFETLAGYKVTETNYKVISRHDYMVKNGYARIAKLATQKKTDTIQYGIIPLFERDKICAMKCEYQETDFDYEVDIFMDMRGKYFGVDEYDRKIV